MGQVKYQIISGAPNFTVSLSPKLVPDQVQSSPGIYLFEDVPMGTYILTIVDANLCKFTASVDVDIYPCILEGKIFCGDDCTITGIIDCNFIIDTTTTTTTYSGLCTTCPEGYTATVDSCYIEDIISPYSPTNPQTLFVKSNKRYGTTGTIVFQPGWNYDGSGSTYNAYTTGNFWINPMVDSIGGTNTDGIMNKNAVWSGVTLDGQTVGFPICIDIAQEKTYLVGLGCDNYAEIKIDGVSVLMQDYNALYTIYADNGWDIPSTKESTFRLWFIYPITLTAGKHIIELIGHNDTNVAAVGLDIYDMSESALMACNSYDDMGSGLLFSTKDEVGKLVKIGNEGQGYSCPEGYVLGYCDDYPMCYKIEYIPCSSQPLTTSTTTTDCMRPTGLSSDALQYRIMNDSGITYDCYATLDLANQGITDFIITEENTTQIIEYTSIAVGEKLYYDFGTNCDVMFDGYFAVVNTLYDTTPQIVHVINGIITEIFDYAPIIQKCYGLLYNWWVASYNTGGASIAPIGWHIPTDTEWNTLATTLGGLSIAGASMKEAGTVNWVAPNTGATNSSGFTALPIGDRDWMGGFGNQGYYATWWSSAEASPGNGKDYHVELNYNYLGWTGQTPNMGAGLRAIKNDNVMSSVEVVDYDGNVYTPIQIGSQIWTLENLVATHFSNGVAIPNLSDSTAWSTTTAFALSAYDNNWIGNACIPEPPI